MEALFPNHLHEVSLIHLDPIQVSSTLRLAFLQSLRCGVTAPHECSASDFWKLSTLHLPLCVSSQGKCFNASSSGLSALLLQALCLDIKATMFSAPCGMTKRCLWTSLSLRLAGLLQSELEALPLHCSSWFQRFQLFSGFPAVCTPSLYFSISRGSIGSVLHETGCEGWVAGDCCLVLFTRCLSCQRFGECRRTSSHIPHYPHSARLLNGSTSQLNSVEAFFCRFPRWLGRYSFCMAGLIYPVVVAWTWGGGWLSTLLQVASLTLQAGCQKTGTSGTS